MPDNRDNSAGKVDIGDPEESPKNHGLPVDRGWAWVVLLGTCVIFKNIEIGACSICEYLPFYFRLYDLLTMNHVKASVCF